MKTILLTPLLMLIAASAFANPLPDDTTGVIHFNDRAYRIVEQEDQITVSVYDGNNRRHEKIAETRFKNGTKETVWQLDEVISFPFSDLISGKSKKEKRRFNPHWAGVGFGFCNATDASGIVDDPRGVSLNFGRSYEIFWNIFTVHYAFCGDRLALVSGVGLDWRNYVMNDNRRFIEDGNHIRVEELAAGQSLKYSRVKTVDFTIPLLLEWQTPPRGRFFLSFGPVIGIKTYSSMKSIYYDNGHKIKYFRKGLSTNPINVDFMVQGGFGHIGLYAKYSPFNIFQEKYAPDMRSFSAGIMLVF